MFKNLKLSVKIGFGFGALILIAVILGGLAVFNMNKIEEESVKLASEYVPEVDVAVKIRGASNRLMYEMRGFGFTEDIKFKNNAKKEMISLDDGLKEADKLADKAIYLKKLKGQLKNANDAKEQYYSYAQDTFKISELLNEYRKELNESAASYIKYSNDFITSQKKAFQKDLSSRQQKIKIVTEIVNIGTKVRVTNFKAQALKDMRLMHQAISYLDGVKQYIQELRPITKDAGNISQMNEIESAANSYSKEMSNFIDVFKNINSVENGNNQELLKVREAMDSTAASYVTNCKSFLDSQQTKLTKDMSERLDKKGLSESLNGIFM